MLLYMTVLVHDRLIMHASTAAYRLRSKMCVVQAITYETGQAVKPVQPLTQEQRTQGQNTGFSASLKGKTRILLLPARFEINLLLLSLAPWLIFIT